VAGSGIVSYNMCCML